MAGMENNVDEDEPAEEAVKRFVLEATIQRVAYLKLLKRRGIAVDEDQISRFEEEIREEAAKLRDSESNLIDRYAVAELQLELAFADLDYDFDDEIGDDEDSADALKALLYRQNHLTVKMWPEQRHERAHFHVKFKNEYSASYAVDSLRLIAGEMPSKYERVVLEWARKYQESLAATWQHLNAGEDVRGLVIVAAEQ